MPKTRPPYAPEFRRHMVALVRAGRDPADVAREFEPSAQATRNWVMQADLADGRREQSAVALAAGGSLPAAEREDWRGCGAKCASSGWSGTSCQTRADRGPPVA